MKANGRTTKEMAEENNSGKMVASTKATGRIISLMVSEGSSMPMGTSTSENGPKTKPTAKAPTFPNAVPNMLETGSKTNRTAEARKHGQIKLFTLESTRTAKNMERENSCGPMTAPMKETSSKTTFTASVDTNGRTAGSTKDNGRTTKCKGKEPSPGLMAENTSESTLKIEKRDLAFLPSRMEEFTKANGWMENSTEGACSRRKISRGREFGRMERGWSGSKRRNRTLKWRVR